MKILLVENNSGMRRLLRSVLNEIAVEIYESPGGGEAIELYQTVRPDWVVMDVYRKPANGLTAASAIKNSDKDAKIVFISNYTDPRTRQWAENAGGEAFFGKDDLLSLVEFLRKEKETRESNYDE